MRVLFLAQQIHMADGDWEQRWDPEQSRQYLYNPVTKERKEMESSAAEDSSLSSEGTQQTAWIGKQLGWPEPNFLSSNHTLYFSLLCISRAMGRRKRVSLLGKP